MGRPKKNKDEDFQPEIIGEGVSRETPIEDPNNIPPEPQAEGNWIKCTYAELCKYEQAGVLIGYKPDTMEVLLKEEI